MTAVFLVEDDPKIRANLLFQLRDEGFAPRAFENAESALMELEPAGKPLPDLLLIDVRLPGISGVELARKLVATERLPPTVIISGEASISETVEALKLGVHDLIEKPFTKQRLMQTIRTTLENNALRQEVAELKSELAAGAEILGGSAAMEELRERIAQAAPTDARVMIRGESGTGKELVANALHRQSGRADKPFIKINCAAIPAHLIEDELFGHVRGAFTDARADKPGLFEEADGVTLFLDEIGDMDYQLQARLLRVLEDGRVRRIGDTQEREVNVRVLAATHADLEEAVREKRFREDLYFRLAGLPLDVPPLRERSGDIRLLFDHFLDHYRRHHHTRARQVEAEVLHQLEAHPWPGNVRELRSLCERLVVFGADPITLDQLPPNFGGPASHPNDESSDLLQLQGNHPIVPLKHFKKQCEKRYLESVLERTGWNVAAAARLLDIQRTHLHRKLNEHGTVRPGTVKA